MPVEIATTPDTKCYHCGETCKRHSITIDEKDFCCEGCKQVYLLLNENDLCTYYDFEKNPGIQAKGKYTGNRFAYLDDESTINKLIQFSGENQMHVTFSLPQMHCSSCVYLLENLNRINPGIIKSQTNFQQKEVFVIFNPKLVSLRQVVELLAFTGYEPYISLQDAAGQKNTRTFNKKRIYKIGVAGFCFANIMMLSFPEYFSAGHIEQGGLKETFAWLNLALSIPVLFFSASGFFSSAWAGLRQRYLNIDAPIALAILVTYIRSYYEIITGQGAGYLDSGTGIVFFMLVGRWFQDKTYDSFSFDRDYKSYFPLGVSVIEKGVEKNIPVTQLQKGFRMLIRNEEMIPADAVLIKGTAQIDYSFVSGENTPVSKKQGELIYAGGKQLGSAIELEVAGEISQNYITRLWNNNTVFQQGKNEEKSFIHPWSRYFTLTLFSIAVITAIFWAYQDPSKILPAVSSALIVACPCSLLLSATFTYGNMLRLFGKNKLYLKNASVIESLAKTNTIVFDKTGTLTHSNVSLVSYEGTPLNALENNLVKVAAAQSSHPLSKIIAASLPTAESTDYLPEQFEEITGKGIEALINKHQVRLGSSAFISQFKQAPVLYDTGTHVHVMIDNVHLGRFCVNNQYRDNIPGMATDLRKQQYQLHILSGDNNNEAANLRHLFGTGAALNFNQSPQQKLDYIRLLQQQNRKVLMLGDGLNDAGALMQSQTGIAVSDNTSRFSPACDALLDGSKIHLLNRLLAFARSGKKIVTASFVLSILYNIVGLSFAVQAQLSPMVAAILMPASSISIVLFVSLLSSISAHKKGL